VLAQHPYDKNDLVVLSEEKDLTLIVREIYLMHTSFEPVDGGKDIHIPHSKLSSDCIENWSRLAQSYGAPNPKGDPSPISVVLHLDPQKKLPNHQDIWELQEDINEFVQDPPSRFYKTPTLTCVPIKEEDLMESGIKVEFRLKRKVHLIIFHPIHPVTKLRRFLGDFIRIIKFSEIKYCITSVNDCCKGGSRPTYPKKASLRS
jgi:hypothetical protein